MGGFSPWVNERGGVRRGSDVTSENGAFGLASKWRRGRRAWEITGILQCNFCAATNFSFRKEQIWAMDPEAATNPCSTNYPTRICKSAPRNPCPSMPPAHQNSSFKRRNPSKVRQAPLNSVDSHPPTHDDGALTDNISRQPGGGNHSQLLSLVTSVTTSPEKELDLGLLKSIKQLVRSSDANVYIVFDLLMEKLKKNHAQVRYLALLVMDELFTRSKLFRSLLVAKFEMFMLLAVGFRSDYPLPPPSDRATLLKAKGMEILERWNDLFGVHYKQLRLGYEYLKNTLRLQFPNLRQAAAQAEQQRKEREARSQALAQKKFESLKEELPVLTADVQFTLDQLDECFDILVNTTKQHAARDLKEEKLDENINEAGADDDGFDEFGARSLRHTRDEAYLEAIVPSETRDNQPIFDSLRDLCKLVVTRHIPATSEWLSILVRVEQQERHSYDLMLKAVIDVRNRLLSARNKCEELGVGPSNSETNEGANDADEIVWELGDVVDGARGVERNVVTSSVTEQTLQLSEHTVTEKKDKLVSSVKSDAAGSLNHDDTFKQELLKQAPVLPWGSFLDRWGAEDVVPANQRGLLLESHWGKVDYDALIPAERFTEVSIRASYYKPQQTEIRPCLTPLRNGKLCQRRDLRVCPLHGAIVPRDCNGNVIEGDQNILPVTRVPDQIDVENSIDKLSSRASKEELIRAVAAKAVANLRRKDEDGVNTKKARRLQSKRDREHNNAVLRAAALARTSQGIGETLGEDLELSNLQGIEPGGKSKRPKCSLTSMLQKKPTAKDRIGKRLLNEHSTDATVRQLTRDEDATYRESFPNQW